MKPVYVCILAGGSGERLWPLSTKEKPKQLVPFLNNQSLLAQTLERVYGITHQWETICIVTHQQQEALIKASVGEKVGFILSEPCGRNTGPAILLACHEIFKRDPEAIVIFLPADHFIPQPATFYMVMQRVLNFLQEHKKIAVLGVKPTFSATGYGYIQAALTLELESEREARAVLKFHEKPDYSSAQSYLNRTDMFWNAGIFAAQVSVFLHEFKKHAPYLFASMDRYVNQEISYSELPLLSIDYAVMEKTDQAVVFVTDFEWYDVGNVPMFLSLQKAYAPPQGACVVSIDGSNNLVSSSKKIVACVGVSDLCIVETDDVLLIVNKDKGELVKKILDKVPEVTR